MDREFLEKCLAEGMSLAQIGEAVGLEKSTVSYHVKKHGLKAVNQAKHANKGPIPKDVLEAMLEDGLSLREMARRLRRNPSSVRHWFGRYGLERPGSHRRREARDALAAGLKHAQMSCNRHGITKHVLENRGSYRCLKCRAETVVRCRRNTKRRLVEEAGGRCVLCGYDEFPGALHFHHVDPSKKSFGLAGRGLTRSIEQIRKEAAKCELLCANCHAKVEWGATVLPTLPYCDDDESEGKLKKAA